MRRLAFIFIILIAPLMYAATVLPFKVAAERVELLLILLAIALTLLAAACFCASRVLSAQDPGMPARGLLMTTAILVAGAFGYLLGTETPGSRLAIITLTVTLLLLYFENLFAFRRFDNQTSSHRPDVRHLVLAIFVAACFFWFSFLFGVDDFFDAPPYIPALVAAAVIGIVTFSIQNDAFAVKERAAVAAAASLLAVEFTVALSFLPTSARVNAAVAVILFAPIAHVIAHKETATNFAKQFRRQTAAALSLVAVVLMTARWT